MIVSESKRCRAITTKLLDFARGREGERALYDVTAIVSEVVGMFRHMREYSGRTVDMNRQDPVRAWCNGPEIKQVVLNLVANALQATPDGGRLDIRVSSTPDAVEVMFTDTGSGMSAETLEHIFDPFFSTKGPGRGTGLGLSISHAIVEKHHGALEAHSAGPGPGKHVPAEAPGDGKRRQGRIARRRAEKPGFSASFASRRLQARSRDLPAEKPGFLELAHSAVTLSRPSRLAGCSEPECSREKHLQTSK